MSEKYLSQLDYGYRVQIGQYSRSFAFSKHGGKVGARAVALKCRDEYLSKKGELYRLQSHIRMSSKRTTTGVVGVYLDPQTKNGKYYARYTGSVGTGNKRYRKTFGCTKYGKEWAFVQACKYLYAITNQLVIVDENLMPVRLSLMRKHFQNIKLTKNNK